MNTWLSCMLVLALSVVGCKSSEDDGSLGGVEASEQLADLSASELREVCESALERVESTLGDDLDRGRCLAQAAFSASFARSFDQEPDLASICGDELDQCISQPLEGGCDMLTEPSSACDATVGEYSRCLDRAAEELREFAMHSCEEVVAEHFAPGPDGGTDEDLADCEDVFDACFNVSGGGERDAGAGEAVDGGTE